MGKAARNRNIRKFALEQATEAGQPGLARSIARSIRRRGWAWKRYRKTS